MSEHNANTQDVVQQRIPKSGQFLDEKINLEIDLRKKSFNELRDRLQKLEAESELKAKEVVYLLSANASLKDKLNHQEREMLKKADLKACESLINDGKDELSEKERLLGLAVVDCNKYTTQLRQDFMLSRTFSDGLNKDISSLMESVSEHKRFIKLAKERDEDQKIQRQKERDGMIEEHDSFMKSADESANQLQVDLKLISRKAEISSRDVEKIRSELPDRLSLLFNERMEDFELETKGMIEKVKGFARNLDRIEHQLLKALQSGNGAKEIEDFMKQVSYNAKQIAKIHQALEGK